jgi:hypothetical protein
MRLRNAVRRVSAQTSTIVLLTAFALTARAEAPPRAASLTSDLALTPAGFRPPSDLELQGRVNRATLERAAIARNPALQAAEHRVRALTEEARAEGGLPEPEFMAWVWQVPIARPYALGDAGRASPSGSRPSRLSEELAGPVLDAS